MKFIKESLVIMAALGTVFFTVTETGSLLSKMEKGSSYFQKPFIIYVESVSPADVKACRADENCMDVLEIRDLPTRDDAQMKEEMNLDVIEGQQTFLFRGDDEDGSDDDEGFSQVV